MAQCTADAGVDIAICVGDSGVIGNPTPGNPATTTYQWTPTTGLSCSTCPNPTAYSTASGLYVLTVTDIPSNCVTTDTVFIAINPLPVANFTFVGTNNCANDPVIFTNTSTGVNPTYLWTFTDPLTGTSWTSTDPDPSFAYPVVGNASQYVHANLAVTSNGCVSNHLDSILINQAPQAILVDPIDDFVNCSGGVFTLTVYDASNPTTNVNYTINWGDGSPAYDSVAFPTGGVSHVYANSGVSNITYVVLGTNGCTDTTGYVTANILNPSIGSANPGGTTGCAPLSLCFPLNNFGSNPTSTTYQVDFGDGSPIQTFPHPPPDSVCHTYTASSCPMPGQLYEFKIKAVNICDSSTATVSPIRVYVGPLAGFTPSLDKACVNTPVTMINTTVLGFSGNCSNTAIFNWDFGDGTTLTTLTLTDPVHIYSTVGNYTVTLVVSNSCGPDSVTAEICIEDQLVAGGTASAIDGCVPLTVTYLDTTDYATSCDTVRNWVVMFNGSPCLPNVAGYSFINGTNASSLSPQIQFTSPGNYSVQLASINSCGTSTANFPVTVRTVPQITVDPLGTICAGAPVTPSGSAISCASPINGYAWTFSGATPSSSTTLNPGPIVYPTAGTYPLSLSVSNGCGTSTQNSGVIVNPIPLALNPAVNSPLCETFTANFTSDVISGITYQWTGPNGFTAASPNTNLSNVTPLNDGMYYVQGILNTCVGPLDSVYLVVNPLPNVNSIATINLCVNNPTIQLGSSPLGGIWTGTGVSPTGSFDATTAGVGVHNVTYTYTDPVTSCTDSSISVVTIVPLPVANAGPDTLLCDQPINIQLVGSPAGGTWIGPNISSSGVFTPNGLGVFTVTYNVLNANNCLGVDTAIVTVSNGVVPNAGNDTIVCELSPTIPFNGLPSGGVWSGSFVTPSGVFTPNTPGVYDIVYSTGSGSCLSQDTLIATVNPLPNVIAGTNQSVCISSGLLSLNGLPAGGTWSGVGISNPVGVFDPTINGAGTFTLTYVYSDPVTGCSDSSTKNVTVNPLPIVDAGADVTLCDQPIPYALSGLPVGGSWLGTNISGSNFTPNGVGVFDAVYFFIDGNGCIGTDTALISVVAPTPADAGLDTAVCVGAPLVSLTATPVGGSWSGPFITPTGDFTPNTAGPHNVVYTFGTGTCLTTDTVEILVNPLPIINAGANQSVCIDLAPFNLIGLPAGGTWAGIGITNPTGVFDPSIAGIGPHILTYSYTDAITTCSNTNTTFVTVNALPIVNAGNDTILCNQPIPVQISGSPLGGFWSGANITGAGLFTPSGVGITTVTYSFTDGNGCINTDTRDINVTNPVPAVAGADTSECINGPNVQLTGAPVGGIWSGAFITSSGDFTPSTAGNHSVYYSYGNGNCLTIDSLIVTVDALPVLNAGLDIDICITAPTINFTAAPLGGTWAGNGITDIIIGTFDPAIAGLGQDTVTYFYTDPTTGCSNEDTLIATVHGLPVPSFTNPPIGCLNAPVAFTNATTGGNTQTWNFGDGGSSLTTNPNYSYIAVGTYNVQLISTSVQGCVDSITQTIDIQDIPTADFSLTPDTACSPAITTFTDLSSGQNMIYSWDFGNGQTSALANPGTQTYLQGQFLDTTYTIQLTVSNICGSTVHNQTMTAMPMPVAIFGIPSNTGCSPASINFINNSTGLPDTYAWDFGDGTTSTSGTGTFSHIFTTGTNDTIYNISLIVANNCGADTATSFVHIFPNTVTSFFNASTLAGCGPLTVDFTNFTAGGTTYDWNFGDGNVSVATNPTHTYLTPGTFTVSLIATDGCGTDTSFATIDVYPSPVISFTATPLTVCINEPISFTNNSIGLSSTTWNFGDGGTSTLSNPTHSYATSGNYYAYLTGTSNGNGCPSTDSVLINVKINPVASFTPSPVSGCASLDVNFINTSTDADFYAWDFDDGNLSGLSTPNHTYIAAGTYNAQLLVTNLNGCSDSVSQTVTVHPVPIANFNFTTSNPCTIPGTANFTNTSTGAINYDWTFGNTLSSSLTNPNTTYGAVGTYPAQLIASNAFGCSDTMIQTVGFYIPAQADFTYPSDSICEGEPLTFTSNSSFFDSIVWNFGNGDIVDQNQVDITFPISGTYPIYLIAYGGGGCNDTMAVNSSITLMPVPVADFDYVNVQLPDPANGTAAFTNTSIDGDLYNWSFGDGATSTEIHPEHNYGHFSTYPVELIARSNFGCVDTILKMVLIDFPHGLFIPTAIHPENVDYEISHFIPKGLGLMEYEILIFDDWGNLIWSSTALDSNGSPTEVWDGTYLGEKVQQDAYVWKVKATFYGGEIWEGNDIRQGKSKRSGTITVLH